MTRIKTFFSIFLICVMTTLAVRPQPLSGLTLKEEEELAKEFLKVALLHYDLIEDPYIVGYVNKVGRRVLSFYPPQPFKYEFYVVSQDAPNAFAAPGGHIFINSGLLEAMEGEGELAGILGHEIAHVVCRHISERIEDNKKINIATLAGIAAGIFLGMGGAGTAATAVTYGTLAAGQSAALAFSRDNERQADQVSLNYLDKAGYGAEGLLTMLQKIRNTNWFGSDQIPTYMVTHPATEERIAYIGAWAELHKDGDKEAAIDNVDFVLMHTRLVALYADEDQALDRFKTAVQRDPGDPMAHYGYGLALSREGSRKDAVPQFKTALEANPFDQMIIRDLGKTYFYDGKYRAAIKLLEGPDSAAYYDPEKDLLLGRAQNEIGDSEAAVQTLERLIIKKPDYTKAYYYLGEASEALGRTGDSHYYIGIYYIKIREWRNAEFHLRNALGHLSDPVKEKKAKTLLQKISGKNQKKKQENRG